MYHKHQFGTSRSNAIFIVFMVSFMSFIFFIFSLLSESTSNETTLAIFLFGFILTSFLIILHKRTKVFLYDDFIAYKRLIGTKEVSFFDVESIVVEEKVSSDLKHSRNNNRYYYILLDSSGEKLMTIPRLLIGDLEKQQQFLNSIKESNKSIVFDEHCIASMAVEQDVVILEKKIKDKALFIVKFVFAGFVVVSFSIPLLLYGLFAVIEKIFN